jgi:hypothetical protein
LVLVATGDVVLVFRDGTAFEAISGQEWVFPVAEFEREVIEYRSNGRYSRSGSRSGNEAIESATAIPEKPGPRGARRQVKDWSQTG